MNWIVAIPLLPALTFVALLPMSRATRRHAAWASVTAMAAALLLSVIAAASVWPGGSEHAVWRLQWPLAVVGARHIDLGMRLDPLAGLMLLVVAGVGLAVQVYSIVYMRDDERRGWFFAVLSLFTAAMLTFVLAADLLLMFVAWELMGLCSYLLIGFWYELEAARAASMKAFLVTRIGDLGFLFALWIVWAQIGSFELPKVLGSVSTWTTQVAILAAVGFLIAAMGKSAQIGLHVWLPDAMAGPTPASALIHAATMVAAGVYLVAVMLPVFEATGFMLTVLLVVGICTALLGGLLACVQHDVKKVLAYSTISQLGLMFVGLGTGEAFPGIFHLTTHAFFKSLLFLGAGAIIHAAHTQDMREMGGIARRMPVTTTTFTIGAFALAGVIPLSGFFSKDEIVSVLLEQGHYLTLALLLVAAMVTAYYVSRLWFRVFAGPPQSERLHEGHVTMLVPMVGLATVTLVLGLASRPLSSFLAEPVGPPELAVMTLSTAMTVAGFLVGWWFYGRRTAVVNTRRIKQRLGRSYDALAQKLYFDLIYDSVFVASFRILAGALARFDRDGIDGAVNGAATAFSAAAAGTRWVDRSVIDGAVNGLAEAARRTGRDLRRLQTGNVQAYQRLVVGALVVLLLVYILVAKGA